MKKAEIQILFEDNNVLLINKPTGISVTADRSGAASLLEILSEQLSPAEPIRLVHRLDKETSGVLFLAKHREAQSRYSSMFAKRRIRKLYLALAVGPVMQPQGRIKAPIARSQRNPRAMHIHPRLGKEAITYWAKLADFGRIVLLGVQPVTGRTHQIRIHLAHRGIPLVIDPMYADSSPVMLSDFKGRYRSKAGRDEPPLIDRLTLHAYQLEVPFEDDSKRIFTAGLDKKFAAAVKLLAKYAGIDPEVSAEVIEKILNNKALEFPKRLERSCD